MTAAVLTRHGGPEALELRDDVPCPEPGDGEVLVEVAAAGVNYTDVATREGSYGTAADPEAQSGWRGPIAFPRIQGGDVAGRIAAVGDGVDADRVGQRVLVDPVLYRDAGPDAPAVGLVGSERDGGFAQWVAVAGEQAHDVAGSPLSDVELGALPVAFGTAAGMLGRGEVDGGSTVVVTGASGGVGLAAVQLGSALGARVIGVSSASKAQEVLDAGAAHVVDRGSEDLDSQLRDLCPQGLDAVVDVAGGPMLVTLMHLVRDDGRVVSAGAVADPMVRIDLRRLYLNNISLIGSSMHTRTHFARLVETARSGALRPVIAATHPLTEIAAAQAEFTGARPAGKIVLTL